MRSRVDCPRIFSKSLVTVRYNLFIVAPHCLVTIRNDVNLYTGITDKAVGGVGYVEDHQSPHEFLHRDDLGTGKFGVANLAV